ncbi:MAG: cation:proton antiporter [Candidatus Methylacidiphilaceae bacterium]
MDHVWFLAAFWLALAVTAGLVAARIGIAVALVEIVLGVIGQAIALHVLGPDGLSAKEGWISFLAGLGAILLTFLAGAELEPSALREQGKRATAIGLAAFFVPFLACAGAARRFLGWSPEASWLAGIALSATSVAVLYTVLLELGLNRTAYGKGLLVACFINDLTAVLMLGFLFAPFGWRMAIFALGLLAGVWGITRSAPMIFRRFGERPSKVDLKYLLFGLFALGGLAVWAGSEAVLPAYILGMALAGTLGKEERFLGGVRAVTLGLLTPFYFLRAGSFVQLPALAASAGAVLLLFLVQQAAKFAGVFPIVCRREKREGAYTTLLMSTGLTFNVICCLYGLSHSLITQSQYSILVSTIIATAVIPTWVANRFFLPVSSVAAGFQPARGVGLPELPNPSPNGTRAEEP